MVTLYDSTGHVDTTVEMYIDGAWVDMTSRVKGEEGITITRGTATNKSDVPATKAEMVLKNSDGYLSTRNPNSPYYGKLNVSTPIRVYVTTGMTAGPLTDVSDTFTRTELSGWGTSTSGDIYTDWAAGGTVGSDWTVNGTQGVHYVPAASAYRLSLLDDLTVQDAEVTAEVSCDTATVAGGAVELGGIMLRAATDISDYYLLRASVQPDESVVAEILGDAGGTLLASETVSGLTWSGQTLGVRARLIGNELEYKVWDTAGSEPAAYTVSVRDNTLNTHGGIGFRSGVAAGNSDVPVTFTWDDIVTTTYAVRFAGEVSAWPNRQDRTGSVVEVSITATNIINRLSVRQAPLRNSLFQLLSASDAYQYWPLNEAENAQSAVSGLQSGGLPLQGEWGYGKVDGPPAVAAEKYPELIVDGAYNTPPYVDLNSASNAWSVEFWFKGTVTAGSDVLSGPLTWRTTGTRDLWSIGLARGSGIDILNVSFSLYSTTFGSALVHQAYPTAMFDGKWHHIRLTVEQTADTEIDIAVYYDGAALSSETWDAADGITAYHTGRIVRMMDMLPGDVPMGITSLSVAHVAIWNTATPSIAASEVYNAGYGYASEAAVARVQRLGAIQSIDVVTRTTAAVGRSLGAQPTGTLLAVCRKAMETDGGVLLDSRNSMALLPLTLLERYNQTPVNLTYTDTELSSFSPADSDTNLVNDMTVSRIGGSSARYMKTTGSYNTSDPRTDPAGVGIIEGKADLNAELDSECHDMASWIVSTNTRDEPSLPALTVELHRAVFTAAQTLSAAILLLDVGMPVRVDSLPNWLPPEELKVAITGYTEIIGSKTWTITFDAPTDTWSVGVYDAVDTRYASGTSVLDSGITSGATSIDVAFTGIRWVRTADDASSLPFDVMVGGELMAVTAVSGTTSPQTFTVTRAVNGIVKAHDAGTPVEVYPVSYYAL